MKKNVISPLAPYNYARCFNAQCPKSDQCLHRLAAIHDTPDDLTTLIINPLCIPEDNSRCPAFDTSEKMHVAWGIKDLFDEVPHKNVRSIRYTIMRYFGKTKYYRIYREEMFITLEEQEFIRNAFREYGINKEPAFSSFSDEYIF